MSEVKQYEVVGRLREVSEGRTYSEETVFAVMASDYTALEQRTEIAEKALQIECEYRTAHVMQCGGYIHTYQACLDEAARQLDAERKEQSHVCEYCGPNCQHGATHNERVENGDKATADRAISRLFEEPERW